MGRNFLWSSTFTQLALMQKFVDDTIMVEVSAKCTGARMQTCVPIDQVEKKMGVNSVDHICCMHKIFTNFTRPAPMVKILCLREIEIW